LTNESISTSAGTLNGQMLKPKSIHSLIRAAGKIPAERSTTYKILKEFREFGDESAQPLDEVSPTQFGSYHELIKIDKYRYKDLNSTR
jgi:5-amino-6-(D-ribitylamino)uracil---L-tyrosine 4-hydroxyphenyl transferase